MNLFNYTLCLDFGVVISYPLPMVVGTSLHHSIKRAVHTFNKQGGAPAGDYDEAKSNHIANDAWSYFQFVIHVSIPRYFIGR
jgi:hypothetical protein